jgi:hypothetical protein
MLEIIWRFDSKNFLERKEAVWINNNVASWTKIAEVGTLRVRFIEMIQQIVTHITDMRATYKDLILLVSRNEIAKLDPLRCRVRVHE